MATCSEINASAPNKSKLEETQSKEITVNFGVFFDGTNNQRLQVAMGKLNRGKNSKKEKEKIKKGIEKIGGTFDEEQFKKNGNIKYTLSDPSTNKEKEFEKLNKKIAKYNKKHGNRANASEHDTIESFAWDEASGVKKDEETIEQALDKKDGFRIGMPRSPMQGVDFTNIARLEPSYNEQPSSDYTYKIYVTGSGTFADLDKGIDITGLAAGQNSAGVIQKVIDAFDAIANVIYKIKANNNLEEKSVNYKFNVFGFSRGATEARLFVDLCSNIRKGKRHSKLEKIISKYNGKFINKEEEKSAIYFAKQKTIEFPFVGIFDTVSSVGINPGIWNNVVISGGLKGAEEATPSVSKYHRNNKEDLGLDTLAYDTNVKHVVHMCALDEFRENFALQVLPTGISKVEQFFLPGVHSDIGGGDLDGYGDEKHIPTVHQGKTLYIPKTVTLGISQKKEDLLEINLNNLKRLGWVKDSNDNSSLMSDITGEKTGVIKLQKYTERGYTFLPLNIMAEKANENSCKFDDLKGKYAIPTDLPQDFSAIQNWKADDDKCKYGLCFFPKEEEKYKFLRQKYLHFSSCIKKTAGLAYVNGPNLTESNDKESPLPYYDRFLDYDPKAWYGIINPKTAVLDPKSLVWEEESANHNGKIRLGEAVVLFQDKKMPFVVEKTTAQQLNITDETKKLFHKYGYSIECDGVLKRIAVGRIPNTKNTTIYGTNGEIKVFDGITTPYNVTKCNTILAGNYKAKKYQMPSKGAYTKQVHDKDKECKTYLISKENGCPPDGTKNGKTNQMSGVYIHRSDGDGIAYKQYEYQKGDDIKLLEIGSSQGCLVIDQRQYADVELLLEDSQDIFISINRT